MQAILVVVGGKADKRQLSIKLPAVLGRSREATLTIAHSLISRSHCELRDDGGVVVLQDMGSLNGTFLGEEKIETARLMPGDEFSIGPLTFRIQYDYVGEIATAPPGASAPQVAQATPIGPADEDDTREVVSHEVEAPVGVSLQPTPIPAQSPENEPAVIAPEENVDPSQPPIELAEPMESELVELDDPVEEQPEEEAAPFFIAPADGELPDLAQWSDPSAPSAQPADGRDGKSDEDDGL